jgi:surface antigen
MTREIVDHRTLEVKRACGSQAAAVEIRHPDIRHAYASQLAILAAGAIRQAGIEGDRHGVAVSIRADRSRATIAFRHSASQAQPYVERLVLLREGGTRKVWSHPISRGPAETRHPSEEEALAIARKRWEEGGQEFLAGFRSGQCTDWAAQKRPDLVERVYEATVVAELLHRDPPVQLGVAQTWGAAAESVGMTVSDSPAAGALVVWQEGVEGANPETGHIGYVESVATDGSTLSTSEMNVGAPYQMGYRTLFSTPVQGRSFIWR